jgi:hypothetical protein
MAGGKTSSSPSVPPRADFDEIEAAVMETARGRWFLAEYARRHRTTDTGAVLQALARLEARLAAGVERTRAEPVVAVPVPRPEPEPSPFAPPAPPPAARTDDLKAMAEELLRGSPLFDWFGKGEEAREEPEADPWAAEPEPAPAPAALAAETSVPDTQESDAEEPLEEEPEVEDEEIAAWEAELAERSAPLPLARNAPLPPRAQPPPFRSTTLPPAFVSASPSPPRPQASTRPELPEIAPKPVERREIRPPVAAAPRPQPASFNEPKPLPSGPRVDDPTLTMTRDEKLALFS